MMIQRLALTVESFTWGNRLTGKEEQYEQVKQRVNALKVEPNVTLYDVFSARSDLAVVEKTNSSETVSAVKGILMGNVPDRGGRH
jgi:hypothetical protein